MGWGHSRRDDSVLLTSSYYSRTTFWRGECRYIEWGGGGGGGGGGGATKWEEVGGGGVQVPTNK